MTPGWYQKGCLTALPAAPLSAGHRDLDACYRALAAKREAQAEQKSTPFMLPLPTSQGLSRLINLQGRCMQGRTSVVGEILQHEACPSTARPSSRAVCPLCSVVRGREGGRERERERGRESELGLPGNSTSSSSSRHRSISISEAAASSASAAGVVRVAVVVVVAALVAIVVLVSSLVELVVAIVSSRSKSSRRRSSGGSSGSGTSSRTSLVIVSN